MPSVRPVADVNPSTWTTHTGAASNRFAVLADDDPDTYVTTDALRRPRRRVLMISTDDGAHWPIDYVSTIINGSIRVGERAREQTCTRVVDKSMRCNAARTDHSPCSPGRAAWWCGLRSQNHFNTKVSVSEYYFYVRDGARRAHIYDGRWKFPGPIERDCNLLAARALLDINPADPIGLAMWAQETVDAADQPFGGCTTGSSGKRNVLTARGDGAVGVAGNDDLQLTGSLIHWLAHAGVECDGIGKDQNGTGQLGAGDYADPDPDTATADYWLVGSTYANGATVAWLGNFYLSLAAGNVGFQPDLFPLKWSNLGPALTTRFVGPGWTRRCVSADDQQDHYRYDVIDFDESVGGPNPAHGMGQIGRRLSIKHDWEIASLTYNGGTGKVTVVTVDNVDDVTPGEQLTVSVDRVTSGTNWNALPEVTATCVDAKTFTFTPAGTPTGTPGLTNAFLYVRKFFQTVWEANRHVEMLESVDMDKDLFFYHGFHMPHASITYSGRNGDQIQAERRYENSQFTAVPDHQGYGWNGVQGTPGSPSHGPDVDPTEAAAANHLKTYYQRQNMHCSADDAIGIILDAWDAKFGADTYFIILVDDNAMQYGGHGAVEDNAWSPIGGKTYVWENSVRVSLFIAGPGFEPQSVCTRLVELADIPLTILALFAEVIPELENHHALAGAGTTAAKRDGTPIQMKMDGALPDMHQFVRGVYLEYLDGAADSDDHKVIDRDGNVLVRQRGTSYSPTSGNPTSSTPTPARELFLGAGADSGIPDETEYETVNHEFDDAGTEALADELADVLEDLLVGCFEPTLGSHTGKI